jgi:large subunit ribosomal protein L17
MFRNQLTALFTHQRIITTVPKAKELRPLAERMVTLARTGTLANRRRILQMVSDTEVVGHLFDDVAPRFSDRPGGYTRIMRLGRRRGDNAELAIIEFVDYEPSFDDDDGRKGKKSLMDRAKGMFGRKSEDAAKSDTTESNDDDVEVLESVEDGPDLDEPEPELSAEPDVEPVDVVEEPEVDVESAEEVAEPTEDEEKKD